MAELVAGNEEDGARVAKRFMLVEGRGNRGGQGLRLPEKDADRLGIEVLIP